MERSAEQRSSLARRRPVRGRDEWGIEFSRIVAFSDGVFALMWPIIFLTGRRLAFRIADLRS